LGLVALYAVFSYLIGYYLMFKASKEMKPIHLGLLLLLEPVIAALLDVVVLGSTLTYSLIIGGSLIIIGNAYMIIHDKP